MAEHETLPNHVRLMLDRVFTLQGQEFLDLDFDEGKDLMYLRTPQEVEFWCAVYAATASKTHHVSAPNPAKAADDAVEKLRERLNPQDD